MKHILLLNEWLDKASDARIEVLEGHGGFSGASFWRVSTANHVFCLRCWPKEHPTLHGLTAIHELLQHTAQGGFGLAPVPLQTKTGKTFLVHEERFWELTPWMPGEANFRQRPCPAKLSAAMQALASFHNAAASYQQHSIATQEGPSPGLQHRLQLLLSLQKGELNEFYRAVKVAEPSELRKVAFELLEEVAHSIERVTQDLEPIAKTPLPLQWCLRDIWHDHVLFEEDRVCGIIDFGAAAVDSVAGDVARLLGSMVDDQSDPWRTGIDVYSQSRPLTSNERRAIAGFDTSGILGSAANWLRWLFVQKRKFSQISAVHSRMLWISKRLHALTRQNGASVIVEN